MRAVLAPVRFTHQGTRLEVEQDHRGIFWIHAYRDKACREIDGCWAMADKQLPGVLRSQALFVWQAKHGSLKRYTLSVVDVQKNEVIRRIQADEPFPVSRMTVEGMNRGFAVESGFGGHRLDGGALMHWIDRGRDQIRLKFFEQENPR